jgi:hypothetical protein
VVLAMLATVPVLAGPVAVIDHSPRSGAGGTAVRMVDAACAVLGGDAGLTIVPPAQSDSVLRSRGIDIDMATPGELGQALGAARILHFRARVRDGRAVLGGKLYDIAERRTIAEQTDSCSDDQREPGLLGAIMGWTFAGSLADSAGAARAGRQRDSLVEAWHAPRIAARLAAEQAARRKHEEDSLVRSRTRKYDIASWPMLALSAGCLVTGAIFHYQANDQEQQAKEMRDFLPYLPSGQAEQLIKIAKAEDDAERYRGIRNTCYWAGGISGCVAAVLIMTRSSVARRVRAEYRRSARGVGIGYDVARW